MADKQPSTPAKKEWLHEGWRELLTFPLTALVSPASGLAVPVYPKVVTFADQKLGLTLQRALFTGKVKIKRGVSGSAHR
jgi:hypothetical protein